METYSNAMPSSPHPSANEALRMPTLASVQSYPIKRKDCEVSKNVGFLIANIPLGPPPSKRKAPAPTRLDDLLINDNEVLMSADNDEDTLCKAISDWKPFVNRVAHFIDNENLPFEYFDIWEPTKPHGSPRNGDERLNEIIASNDNNGLCLRHVGHGTKGDLELSSIFTMYQLQQFGECSEKYSFPPGVGLPGRVFETGEPMIDNALQYAQFRDFPRANLAKKFNVKRGLGIPIVSQASSAIVVLYATGDTPIDVGVVRAAYQEFHKYRAQLPLTYISSENAIVQRQARRVPDEIEFENLTSRKRQDDSKRIAVQVIREWELLHARRHKAILPDDIEVEMAKMLAAGGQQCDERSALIFLLWRPPCRRNRVNNDLLDALKQKYNVMKEQYQDNEKIALQVLEEWGKLNLHEYNAILPDETEIEMAKMLDDHRQYSSLFFLLWRAPCRRSRTVNEFLDVLKENYKTFKEQQDDAKKIAWQVLKEWDLLNGRNYTADSSDETEVEMAKLLMHQQENSISPLLRQVPSRRSRAENEMVDVLKHKYKALKGKNACAKKVILQIVKEWDAFTKEELATTQVGTNIEKHEAETIDLT